ncbi:MAG: HTH domain-containing protein [candidate division Zixibacteria bacterium]|nr:HTH domain-containing protein [candidate division Zixibacteria bacterium]
MSALNQLIVIVNLLYNRRGVTLKSIMKKCDISRRTAFRYLDKISRAGFPLYYDKDLRGYTFCNNTRIPLNQLDINEAVILIVALVNLSKNVDSYYKEPIQNLLGKIENSSEIFIEDIVKSVKTNLSECKEETHLTKLITSSLLQAAIEGKSKTSITLKEKEKYSKVSVENPKLKFDKIWRVSENTDQPDESILVSKIVGISIK